MNFAQAGVPFIHCLESLKRVHGVCALAGFPVSAGCGEELGDALDTGTAAQGKAAVLRNRSCWVAVPARGASSTASPVERADPAPVLSCSRKMWMKL